MQPRFRLVDKNEGKSTAKNPLDTKASARTVVPAYADPDVLEAINVLLAISASKGREKLASLTADVQAALMKGEFQDKDRVLYCWPRRTLMSSTWQSVAHLERRFWVERCTSQVVGKIPKVLVQIWFRKQRMCFDLFTLHPPAGVLSGVICLHVDDMLGTGQELFESKLKEHDKLVGFGSMKRQSSITAKDSTKNMPVEKSQFP